MPRNDKTIHAFDRYSEFLFAGRCWKVQAPDDISMRNVLEVNAEEDYINLTSILDIAKAGINILNQDETI